MPTPGCNWPVSPVVHSMPKLIPHCQETLGAKRKADTYEEDTNMMEFRTKRRRCWFQNAGFGDSVEAEEEEINHNNALMTTLHSSHAEPQALHAVEVDASHEMEMDDGAAGDCVVEQVRDSALPSPPLKEQEACDGMDSDCTHNPTQYKSPKPTSMCQEYCGDTSPTSGKVRCYCKPSWEGLMYLRPFDTDIY
ncbi:PREDICTED: uncharacterized protein LOC106807787 [Priapulus caudatus]|uniref:Uncharacterized protein LOC106807787 n=1 Tax=Priapulus caudatus TaxID=37621 RepID=A0ABM1E0K5_PRICU|nr:PREDICTED: uncharacterized protein LOC106807787 [Priapulus caudatus]